MESVEIIKSNATNAAFPLNFEYSGETPDGIPSVNTKTAFGLTKREYIATKLLAGILSTQTRDEIKYGLDDMLPLLAVKYADLLLIQLNK